MSRKHSPIEIQISAQVKAPRNGRPITEAIIRQAIDHKIATGDDVPGIKLNITRWRHHRRWTDVRGNDAAEWDRFRIFLPEAEFRIEPFKQIRSR